MKLSRIGKRAASILGRSLLIPLFVVAGIIILLCSSCSTGNEGNDAPIVPETPPVLALKSPLCLPEPQGPYGVGKTVVFFEDEARTELLCPDEWTNKNRRFAATVYYPVIKGTGDEAPYVTPSEATAWSFLTGESETVLEDYHSHSVINGTRPAPTNFPVLLFSCGGGELPQFYASLTEEIASYGFVVFSVSDSFDAPATVLGDGSTAFCPRDKNTGTYIFQNALTKKALSGDMEAYKTLEDYEPRPEDLAFVLSRLNEINTDHTILRDRLDIDRIGVFGHSIGGAAAVQTGLDCPEVDVVAVLDSDIYKILEEDSSPLTKPALMLYSDSSLSDEPSEDNALNARTSEFLAQSPYYSETIIEGIAHMAFMTDFLWIEPLWKSNPEGSSSNLGGKTAEQAYTEITDPLIRFFCDRL
jgi:dienelactone hydrolase